MSEIDAEVLSGLEHQLARIERLLAIGFSEQIAARSESADLDDPASAEVLLRTSKWVGAGPLKKAVVKATGQSEPTVKRRLRELVKYGALESEGAGPSVEYRSTGLLG